MRGRVQFDEEGLVYFVSLGFSNTIKSIGYSLIGAFSFDITISNILLGFAKFSYYHVFCKSSISPSPNM